MHLVINWKLLSISRTLGVSLFSYHLIANHFPRVPMRTEFPDRANLLRQESVYGSLFIFYIKI